MNTAIIFTDRFFLRKLNINDVTDRYLNWFYDEDVIDYIEMTALKPDILMLQQYISSKSNLDNILFLGIFNKLNNEHIGNLKFEPINVNESYAIMGILIGEKVWRGKGVAAEVLSESFKWLKKNKGIKCIVLGVNKKNYVAIRAYAKVGFQIQPTKYIKKLSNDNITMIKQLI